jgi:hypothetical protein
MHLVRLMAAAPLALALTAVAALAGDGSAVTIPYGDWAVAALPSIRDGALALASIGLAWAGRHVPGYFTFILKSDIAQQWLAKALDAALNQVAGAAKGKALTADVGSKVIAQAAQNLIDGAPRWLVEWLGGQDGIRKKLLARIELLADHAISEEHLLATPAP